MEETRTESAGSSLLIKILLSISAIAVTNALNVTLAVCVAERPCGVGLLVKLRVSRHSQNGSVFLNPYV